MLFLYLSNLQKGVLYIDFLLLVFLNVAFSNQWLCFWCFAVLLAKVIHKLNLLFSRLSKLSWVWYCSHYTDLEVQYVKKPFALFLCQGTHLLWLSCSTLGPQILRHILSVLYKLRFAIQDLPTPQNCLDSPSPYWPAIRDLPTPPGCLDLQTFA